MSELKPCPFCGGRAIMKIQKHIPNGYDYTPTCQDPSCAGRLTKKWTNEAVAIEAWNNRAMSGSTEKSSTVERTAKVVEDEWTEHIMLSRDYGKIYYQHDCCCDLYESPYQFCPYCGKKMKRKNHE